MRADLFLKTGNEGPLIAPESSRKLNTWIGQQRYHKILPSFSQCSLLHVTDEQSINRYPSNRFHAENSLRRKKGIALGQNTYCLPIGMTWRPVGPPNARQRGTQVAPFPKPRVKQLIKALNSLLPLLSVSPLSTSCVSHDNAIDDARQHPRTNCLSHQSTILSERCLIATSPIPLGDSSGLGLRLAWELHWGRVTRIFTAGPKDESLNDGGELTPRVDSVASYHFVPSHIYPSSIQLVETWLR